LHSDQQVVMVK